MDKTVTTMGIRQALPKWIVGVDVGDPHGDRTVYQCMNCGFFAPTEGDVREHKCWEPVHVG